MNIDDLTYKEIQRIFNSDKEHNLTKGAIGKYVIVRSLNEGLNAGTVVKADETGIILKNARRLWYIKPKDSSESWYEGVAKVGLHETAKVSSIVSEKIIVEAYSITFCTHTAEISICEKKTNES